MGVSTTGIGSGIDIRLLVDNLIEAESKDKIKKYDLDEATTLAKISGLGTIKNVLSSFVDMLDVIYDYNPFDQKKLLLTETNSGNTVVQVEALRNVENGEYSLEVTQLAKEQKVGTIAFDSPTETVGTGTLILNIHSNTYPITINNSNNTVNGICAAINELKGITGIGAKIINSDNGASIVLASQTGLDHTFTVSVTADGDSNDSDNAGLSRLISANLSTLQTAQNAIIKIEGISVTSNSNEIDNAIDNLVFTLLDTNINDPIKLNIKNDIQGVKNYIYDFVKSYNEVFDTIGSLTQYNNSDTTKNGILIADSTLRMISFTMRKVISERVLTLAGGVTSLIEMGITSDRYTGKLEIDDKALDTQLNEKYDSIKSLLTQDGQGIVRKMNALLSDYVVTNGIIQEKTTGLTQTLAVVAEQRITLERHLISLEKRLLEQFIAMDKVVAHLRSVSDFLTKQLDSLLEPMMNRK